MAEWFIILAIICACVTLLILRSLCGKKKNNKTTYETLEYMYGTSNPSFKDHRHRTVTVSTLGNSQIDNCSPAPVHSAEEETPMRQTFISSSQHYVPNSSPILIRSTSIPKYPDSENKSFSIVQRKPVTDPIRRIARIGRNQHCEQRSTSTSIQENPSFKKEESNIVRTNSNVGPIQRIVPLSPSQLPVQRLFSAALTSPSSHRCAYYDHSSAPLVKSEKPAKDLRSESKNKRATPTPIIIAHPPHSHGNIRRHSYSRPTHLEEDEEVDEFDQESEDEDEEDEEGAVLDLRGLFVREALAAVTVFLPEQDQKYIESEFSESHRFVYIITGWGKLSPGKIPKLKPAVEDLLNSPIYKLKYEYQWTNNGEMEVDLIGRKTDAELREKAEKRMRQRKLMNQNRK